MVGYKIRYIADDVFLFCVYMGGWWEGGPDKVFFSQHISQRAV